MCHTFKEEWKNKSTSYESTTVKVSMSMGINFEIFSMGEEISVEST